MKNNTLSNLLSKTIYGVFCIFLCALLTFYYTTIYGYAIDKFNIEEGGSSPKVSTAVKDPNKLPMTSFLSSSYLYYGTTTKVLISTNGGSTFSDDTANLLANGYVGKVGENTVIRIQLSGYKYNENSFTYNVSQVGGVQWTPILITYYSNQDNTNSIDIYSREYLHSFTSSSGSTYWSRVRALLTAGNPSQKSASIYQYTRGLRYYTSPQFGVLRNGSAVSGVGSSGDISQYSNLSKSYNATYNTFSKNTGSVFGYWSMIANSYAELANTSRNQTVKDQMSSDGCNSLITNTAQWDTADTSAYNALDYMQYSTTGAQQYTVYNDINLSTVTDPNSVAGQYSISLDSGAVTSSTFNLSLYQVIDSPLTMQESATPNTISTDTAQLKVYNGTGQTMNVSTDAASGTLGSNPLTFKNLGYLTTSNVGTLGSTTAMSNIELYTENKNLNTGETLSTIAAGSSGTYTILLKNANAISQALSGTITFNATFNAGGAINTKSISVGINSAVQQISISVPISININAAKDGSTCFQYQTYYLGNNSTFPVSTQVSATLVQTDTTGKDSLNNAYFPAINTDSSFKLWVQSAQSSNIQFTSVTSGTTPTNFNSFGSIAANGGKLTFNLTSIGTLPQVTTPGTYHYKIYFKFSYSSADYS